MEALAALDHHLAVAVTANADTSPQVSVVNLGVIHHPGTGSPVVAFVARTGAKLRNLRRQPEITLVIRAGWEWIAVSGPVTLAGPDDQAAGLDDEAIRSLLRRIFHAAGGRHADLDHYDATMIAERRCAVLVEPQRFTTNPSASQHMEPTDR